MFGSDWSSACKDIKYLICHVTSQNHVIDGSSNFVSWSSSWYVTILSCLVARNFVLVETKMLLVCHVIKINHVDKGSGGSVKM